MSRTMNSDLITGDPTLYDEDWTDADQNIDALIIGTMWDFSGGMSITYSFPDAVADYSYTNGIDTFDGQFTSTWQAQARLAIAEYEKVTGITFTEVTSPNDQAVLRFAEGKDLGTAFGYYPFDGESGGDMFFNYSNYNPNANIGTYTFATILHELGHAMGLKHGHEDDSFYSPSGGPVGPGRIETAFNSLEYTQMTYKSYSGQPDTLGFYTTKSGHYPQTLMMLDIAALHRLYGADYTDQAGDSVYTFDTFSGEMFINGSGQGVARTDSGAIAQVTLRTVWDGNGDDTYDFANFTTDMAIDLTPGGYTDFDVGGNLLRSLLNQGYDDFENFVGASEYEYARGHLFNAMLSDGDLRSLIENANGGSGDDAILGNQGDNKLVGNDGGDTITGGEGKDRLEGGQGIDKLYGGDQKDNLIGGKGKDRLLGEGGKDNLTGGKGKDRLEGGDGNDTMDGGRGDDRLFGQGGDNTLTGGLNADIFMFNRKSGNDVITDWEDGIDKIEITTKGGYSGFSVNDNGTDIVIDYGFGNTVTLLGMSGTTIDGSDIIEI
ncbi:MAG: matrixin family metalloprotease [Pseudomonadota bacterium]